MSGEGSKDDGDQTGSGGAAGSTGDDGGDAKAPQWATDLVTKMAAIQTSMDDRFAGLSKKTIERIGKLEEGRSGDAASATGKDDKGGDGGKPATAQPAPGLTTKDVEAITRFGALREKLPEKARKGLDEIREEHGYGTAALIAENLLEHGASNGAQDKGASSPKGHGASPGDTKDPAFPKTVTEMRALEKKDPKRASAIWENPDFDPDKMLNV